MQKSVLIESIETISCDAGWRNYYFIKLKTDNGVVGWSEYDESFGPLGVTQNIKNIARALIGKPALAHELIYTTLYNSKRAMFAGVAGQAIGAIENALLDAKAKILGIPCYDLLGGKLRDKIRVYWSHCGPWRMPPRSKFYNAKEIRTLEDVKSLGAEAKEKGYTALKTYPFQEDGLGGMHMWSPGFGNPYQPDLNIDRNFLRNLREYLEAFRDGSGPEMDILLDLNFNVRPEGLLKIIRELKNFDLFWLEIDHNNPESLAYIRSKSPFPIASCETLLSGGQYQRYLQAQSIDIAIIDAIWNGVWQSMKIAAIANTYDVNIAPHNFYGHLATMINAHFGAAVPNFRILETDVDRLPWDKDLFPEVPLIKDSYLILPNKPGWGCDPDENVLRSRAVKS